MKNPSVVVVDDEQKLADVYTRWVNEKYQAETAYGGEEAIELVDEDTNLVFLDRKMPDLTGGEVLQQLREQGYDGWVVMVTAKDPGKEIIGMEFDAYISKPVSKRDLLNIIDTIQDRAKYNEAIREYSAIKNKLAVLTDSIEDDRRDDSQFYQELKKEAEALEDQIGSTGRELDVLLPPDEVKSG